MTRLGATDVAILSVAARGGGGFGASDLAGPDLAGLGTGRLLDALASLRDRGLISAGAGGSFAMTDEARSVLWDRAVPLWARILRLLQARSCGASEVAGLLGEPAGAVADEVGALRRAGFVLASPQRSGGAVMEALEILPDGEAELERAGAAGPWGAGGGRQPGRRDTRRGDGLLHGGGKKGRGGQDARRARGDARPLARPELVLYLRQYQLGLVLVLIVVGRVVHNLVNLVALVD